MKKSNYIIAIICSLLIAGAFFFNDKITDKLVSLLDTKPSIIIKPGNKYTKSYDFDYIKLDATYIPYGYQLIRSDLWQVLSVLLSNDQGLPW